MVSEESRPATGLRWVLLGVAVVWLWVTVPLAFGQRTLFLRDVSSLHFPLKAFGAAELAHGRIPAFDPLWGLGQPFRGNPQTLAFYPDNLLYLILPFWSAFNLHYALHWLLAFVAMALLARELGARRPAATLAGLAYAAGGWMLTALSFYHIVAVSSWWPLVLWGAARGGRRGIALGGIACGLALLGGEPLLAALGLVPLLLVAIERHGRRRGLLTVASIGALGLLIALPQVVATLRILPFTFRGAYGVPAGQVSYYALAPVRFIELLLPLPFGHPADLGPLRYWGGRLVPELPLIFSLYSGIVALALALAAIRTRRGWAILAVAGLLLAWLGGVWSGPLTLLSFGLFRFPEKLLFWPALALPLLAAWGLEVVLAEPERWARRAFQAAAALMVLALVTIGALPLILRALDGGGGDSTVVPAHALLWVKELLFAAALLAAAAWTARRRRASLLVAVELVALLQLSPLVQTDSTAAYRQPAPWRAKLEPGAAVVCGTMASPFIDPQPDYPQLEGGLAGQNRLAALDLAPMPGALGGLSYPLAQDADGFAPPFYTFTLFRLPFLRRWPQRLSWMRATGVESAVLATDPRIPGLTRLDTAVRAGSPVGLFRIEGTAPPVWWPRRLVAAANPARAFAAVSLAADPVADVVVPEAPPQDPQGSARLVMSTPDRVELTTEGKGGVVALRRAFQPLLAARLGSGRPAATMPLNLDLTGIVVPPGHQRVVLEVSALPETIAGAIALLALAIALVTASLRGTAR